MISLTNNSNSAPAVYIRFPNTHVASSCLAHAIPSQSFASAAVETNFNFAS